MNRNIKKLLLFSLVLFAVIMISLNVNAATIKETTDTNDNFDTIEDGTIVIGISKFTPNKIITGIKAATAGANDMKIYISTHDGSDKDYTYPKMYYYLLEDWYEYDAEGQLEVVNNITSFDIYYVDNVAKKDITIPTIPEKEVEIKEHTVFFVANNKVYKTEVLEEGKAITLNDSYKPTLEQGYTFDKFVDEKGNTITKIENIQSDMVISAEIKAQVTPEPKETYKVFFVANNKVYKTEELEEGKTVTLNDSYKPTLEQGYTFDKFVDEKGNTITKIENIQSDMVISAEIKAPVTPEPEKTYTVFFMDGTDFEVRTVTEGKCISDLPEFSKENHTFVEFTDKDGNKFDTNTPVNGNIAVFAKWKLTTAIVENEQQLKDAIANNDITTIKLGASFEVNNSVLINRSLTIDGQGKTIKKSGTPSFVPGGDNYIFKLYSAEGTKIELKNMALTNNMGAIIVGSNVEVTVDNIDVTGNVWGGIEVSHNGSLIVKTIKMDDEEYKKPVVWIDTDSLDTAKVTYEGATSVEVENQNQYYTRVYTVTYNTDGGTAINEEKVVNGQKATRPTDPTKEGHIFKGWYLEDAEYNFDTILDKNIELTAKWKSTTAVVNNETELKEAIADTEITTIELGTSFTVTESVLLNREITIDGKDNKISFENMPQQWVTNGNNYVVKVYNTTATLKNIALSNSLAGLQVNSSNVTLEGTIDVTGNKLGGMEVSQSSDTTLPKGTLTLNGTLKMDDESLFCPAIWLENEQGTVNVNGFTSVPTAAQTYYFSKAEAMKTANVDTLEKLKMAITTNYAENINLTSDIEIADNTSIVVSRNMTIDGNNHTLAFKDMPEKWIDNGSNYVVKVYNTTATLKNIKLSNSLAGLQVNSSNVTLEGNVDIVDNKLGGIEVSQSSNTGLPKSKLTVNGTVSLKDESTTTPVIWVEGLEDTAQGTVEVKGTQELFATSATNNRNQLYYYTNAEFAKVTVANKEDLKKALEDTTISTIEISEPITVEEGTTLELELNGHKVVTTKTIVNNGELILSDKDGTGEIVTNETSGKGIHAIKNTEKGKLTIKSGTYDATTHSSATVYNVGEVIIDGGTFRRSNENGKDAYDNGGNSYYLINNYGKMTINDGDFSFGGEYSSLIHNGYQNYTKEYKNGGIAGGIANPEMIINGGKFSGGLNTVKNDDGGILTINGGEFTTYAQQAVMNWNIATINGGVFDGTNGDTCVYNAYDSDEYDKGQLTVNGGKFTAPQNRYMFVLVGKAKLELSNTSDYGLTLLDYDGSTLPETHLCNINNNANATFTDNRTKN